MRILGEFLDVWVLLGVKIALDFCRDWFSWTQRWMERGLFGVWLTCWPLRNLILRERFTVWDGLVLLCFLVLFTAMHTRSSRQRVERLLRCEDLLSRVLTLLLVAVMVPPELLFRHSTALKLVNVVAQVSFVTLLYVMALPWDDGGEPGRKRKAAVEKIVGSFGGTYEPEAA